jgi:hypothetical protein
MYVIICSFKQFARPRGRGKKLQEEWAVPLKSVEDISEVTIKLRDALLVCMTYKLSSFNFLLTLLNSDLLCHSSALQTSVKGNLQAAHGQSWMVFNQRQRLLMTSW